MLTLNRQKQAVADLIHDLPVDIDPQKFEPKHKRIWDYIDHLTAEYELDKATLLQELHRWKMADGNDDLRHIIDDILNLNPGQKSEYPTLAQIGPTLPEIQWLWRGWIPRGYLTLLAAAPGVGKSYFALDIAYRLANGLTAPDDNPFEIDTPARIIYVDAEDFLPVLYQRVGSWQMDMTKFYPFQRPPRSIIDLADPGYQDVLIDMVYDLRPALVIVDSLSRVNRRGENSVEEVREVLDIMVQIPQSFDCSLILVHHLRKKSSNQINTPITVHDIRGSGDLIAASRSVIGMDAIQTDQNGDANGPRRLKILKTNLTQYPDPLAINFRSLPDNPDYVKLEYNRAAIFDIAPKTKTAETAEWLLDTLANGPVAYTDLIELLDEELGYNETVLQRARKSLGLQIADTIGPKAAGNKWSIADDSDEDDEETIEAPMHP